MDHHWYDDQPIRETPGQKVMQLFAQRKLCLFNADEKLIICWPLQNLAFYVPMTFLISDVGLTDECNFAWLVVMEELKLSEFRILQLSESEHTAYCRMQKHIISTISE